MSVFQQMVKRFWRDRRGNYAMLMGILAPTLVLAAGYGVNVAQLSTARSNLLAALDSAVTSTARDITNRVIETQEEAEKMIGTFLRINGQRAFSEGDRIQLESVVINREERTVTAEASVVVDALFPLFGAANQNRITTSSAALYSDRRIEVSIMLDLTGSMLATPAVKDKKGNIIEAATDKIGDLKKAAKNAVTSLLSNNKKGADPRVRIALVPYANSVNVGPSIARAAVYVEKSTADRRQAPSSTTTVGGGGKDNCATERKGKDQYTDAGPTSSMVNRDYLLDGFVNQYSNEKTCPVSAIIPLTTDEDALKSSIDRFVATGGTAGHIGIQWAWYMLSEHWADVVGPSAAPAMRGQREVGKYAILMTDGEFNLSYFDVNRASDAYNSRGKKATRDSASILCKAMRDAGIEIFTVGFLLDSNEARETMRDCASPDTGSVQHYFNTSSGEELNAAFQRIASNIERLALTR